MRIFLSFNSKDVALAEAIRAGLSKLEPDANIFFSPVSLGSGLWLPKLGAEIAEADAFLLLIGPKGIGPWQEVEYYTAFDRHVTEKTFALVPVMAASAQAPGLTFLRSLNWVEAPVVTEDAALHRVLAALKGEASASTTPLWKLVNPYCGLEAMTEANADYFYGRTVETSEVLNALASKPNRLPILIGASGVGKSSVALAGVLSALKAMRWPGTERTDADKWPTGLQNSRGWVSLTLRPGAAPLEALAGAFIGLWGLDTKDPDQAALPGKWAKGLFAGDNKLAHLINATQEELKKRQGDAPEQVLLYLDQGEELYTHATPNADGALKNEARRFSEVLAEGLSDSRVLAFASLRADYFDRLQADEPLFKRHEHVNVPPLDRDQLQTVVSVPARVLGVTFEDDKIADRITDAAAAEPGALPLLSYLLTDMWADMVKRDNPTLGLPAHAIDIGGVLASRAEAFLRGNPSEEKALRRLLTLKLAIVPAEGEPIRRQTHREDCTVAEWSLASRLADNPYRLVVMSERVADGRIVAEVAHEAFLRAWPRLAQWLREERDFLVFKGEAERGERRWRDMGQADKALLTGLDLARAEEWLPKRTEDLSTEVIAYVQRSITFDRAIKERQLRFQRRVTVGAVAGALLMAVIGGFAWVQWGKADRAQKEAEAQRQRAEDTLAAATKTANSLVFDLAQRFSGTMGIPASLIKDILDKARALQEQLIKSGQVTPDLKYSEAVALDETVDALLAIGDTKGALAAAKQAQQIMADLLAANSGSSDYQSELLWSYMNVGDVQMEQGDLAGALKSYRDRLAIAERLAQSDPSNAGWQNDLSWSYIKVGHVLVDQGDLAGALTSYSDSLAIMERLAQSDPGNAGWQRDLAVAYSNVGDVEKEQGDLAGALKSYHDSLTIFERLAQSDPNDASWQHGLGGAYENVGNVQKEQGDLAGALKSYRDLLSVMERLAQSDPGNAGWQNDLGAAYSDVGDVQKDQGDLAGALKSYHDSLAISERLAQSDPGNARWQHGLATAYNEAGDVQKAQGDLAGALKSYRDLLAIIERLAQSDPSNAGWQRDLAAAYNFVGDVQTAQADLAGAFKSYQADLAIIERLAQSDPSNTGWQHDLGAAYSNVGDVQKAQGDLAGALKSYQADLAISERLAQSDPGNAGWQHGLAAAYQKVGDVQVAQGDLAGALTSYRDSLAVMERLAQSDPSNADWQHDLGAAYNNLGEVQEAQGDLTRALQFFQEALAIADRLAKRDPDNPQWQHALSYDYKNVGDVNVKQGKLDDALQYYGNSFEIRQRLAKGDPSNADWQHDLAESHGKLAEVYRQSKHRDKALAALREGQAIMDRLAKLAPDNVVWKRDLAWFNDQIANLTK